MFAERIKDLRIRKKKTQQQLADVLKIRRSTYGEYERGKIVPPADKMQVLAEQFGVSVDYLINGNTAPPQTDVEKILFDLIHDLNSQTATLDGVKLNADSRELLISTLENSVKMAKAMNKS